MKRDVSRGFAWTLGGLLALILVRTLQTFLIVGLLLALIIWG